MQYGESRRALVVEENFMQLVKKEFEIQEEVIVQKFETEWQEYVDVKSVTEIESLG